MNVSLAASKESLLAYSPVSNRVTHIPLAPINPLLYQLGIGGIPLLLCQAGYHVSPGQVTQQWICCLEEWEGKCRLPPSFPLFGRPCPPCIPAPETTGRQEAERGRFKQETGNQAEMRYKPITRCPSRSQGIRPRLLQGHLRGSPP